MNGFGDEVWFDQSYEPSTADDVFTFAGTILKIMSGLGPYERRRPSELVSIVKGEPPARGNHPELLADDPLWDLLLRMWDVQNPLARPSMDVVARESPGTSIPTPFTSTAGHSLAEELSKDCLFYPKGSRIWSGPYSEVHKAWCTLPNRNTAQVAVKKLRAFNADDEALNNQLLNRLAREATIWLGLKHENILELYGYQSSPDPILVSPWSETGSLRKFLTEGPWPHLDLAKRLPSMLEVAKGINYLHHRDPNAIIHGDIKPENVVLGPKGEALLCDFGLARIHQGETGHTEHVGPTGTGTQGYRAPEVTDPWTQDKPADIWALGSLFVTCLSLQDPWYNVEPNRKWEEAVAGKYPTRDQHPKLPENNSLWDLIEWCWSQDPDRRPNSLEVVTALAKDPTNESKANLTQNMGSLSLPKKNQT
ncbi:hypothetical protein FRC00_007192 [Tulasnella sp. 408]|nr:hypothetical protein FRC00_007192 [Tulasnella sp. 408]